MMDKKLEMFNEVLTEDIHERLNDEQFEDMLALMNGQYEICSKAGLGDSDTYSILCNLVSTCCVYSDNEGMIDRVRRQFLQGNLGVVLLDSRDNRWSSHKLGPVLGWSLDVWELYTAVNAKDNMAIQHWAPKATEAIMKAREFRKEVDTCELKYCSRNELLCGYLDIMQTIDGYMPIIEDYIH